MRRHGLPHLISGGRIFNLDSFDFLFFRYIARHNIVILAGRKGEALCMIPNQVNSNDSRCHGHTFQTGENKQNGPAGKGNTNEQC